MSHTLCYEKILHIEVVYLFQAEDTSHHFHIWLIPRYNWMEKKFGKRIESIRPIIEYAKEKLKTKINLDKVDKATQKLKHFLR